MVNRWDLRHCKGVVFPYFCETSSSTFNLNIRCTFNNLPASFRRLATFCGSLLLVNGIFIKRKGTVYLNFAENNVKSVARRAATFIRYRCSLGHYFAYSAHFPSKPGILSAHMLDYIDKKNSMRKSFMCGAMKTVSLLFDQPTYFMDILRFPVYKQYMYS